ncbi:restriction endonuclease [Streptomyces marispadix]|uniref:Restriction endonuclease n=1 Tax=Streptomyces marispadix TaxID=2922868 RepID=A0ABS9T233_9ACTN|nr:restriction endonuclease [Streptomyces marispadix]MCH6162596.1 restriction endonuclease [Streptomyces marispadix]
MSRRRPPQRRRTRRRSRRQQKAEAQAIAYGLAAAAAVTLFVAVVNWIREHPWTLLVAIVVGAAVLGGWHHQRRQKAQWEQVRARGIRYTMSQLDSLHHREFEHAIRDLMKRDGCSDAVQVGGAGDNGADVKATDPLGRRWVIQAKHRRKGLAGSPIGTPDLHVLNGTARQLHGADVVVLVTNGRFTSGCPPLAKSQRLHLVDRHLLGEWAASGRPLWDLLRAVPPPGRSTTLH